MSATNRMHMANSFDPHHIAGIAESDAELIRRRSTSMGAAYRLFYRKPIHIVRGEGVLLYDADGNEYLDAYNNVPVVGHSNPVVKSRVAQQLGTLNTHTRYLSENVVNYADRLTGLFPDPLTQAIFVCTGSEAVDLSLRIARHVTGRSGVLATGYAYHGTTQAAAEISPSLGPNNPIPEEVVLVQAPDLTRDQPAAAAEKFAAAVREGVAKLRAGGFEPAALIVDSILSSDGLQGTAPQLLKAACDEIHKAGGLYIADEVQAGFGRTGNWWGFPAHGCEPDLVVLGKPMGNGLPIAAVVGREEIFEPFGRDLRYFNTFGGNPVSIAAADAVLDELTDRDLVARAASTGAHTLEGLRELSQNYEQLAATRGLGLFFALEIHDSAGLPSPALASEIVNVMREQERVLISASGPAANVLKIRPPLVFENHHANRFLDAMSRSLSKVLGDA